MRKSALGSGALVLALLAWIVAMGCSPAAAPSPGDEEAGEGAAVSVGELVAGLDRLMPEPSVKPMAALAIPKPSGLAFSNAELTAFLNGLKTSLAKLVAAATSNSHRP